MDPVLAGKTAEFLQTTGSWGLVAVCFAVITLLWRDSLALRKQIADLAEKRTVETAALAEKTATGLANASHTAAVQATVTDNTNRIMQQVLDVVKLLPLANETLSKQLDANAGRIERVLDAVSRDRP